jgi:hypothetical protein
MLACCCAANSCSDSCCSSENASLNMLLVSNQSSERMPDSCCDAPGCSCPDLQDCRACSTSPLCCCCSGDANGLLCLGLAAAVLPGQLWGPAHGFSQTQLCAVPGAAADAAVGDEGSLHFGAVQQKKLGQLTRIPLFLRCCSTCCICRGCWLAGREAPPVGQTIVAMFQPEHARVSKACDMIHQTLS